MNLCITPKMLWLLAILPTFFLSVSVGTTTTTTSTSCPPDPSSPMLDGPIAGKSGVARLINEEIWETLFKGTMQPEASTCTGTTTFFSLDSFLEAAQTRFPEFANSGDFDVDRRELAAFLAHTSHETSGGWATAPCGYYAWGLCFKSEVGCANSTGCLYCSTPDGSSCTNAGYGFTCPCAPGERYYGRGPIQLSYEFNYALCSDQMLGDFRILLDNPDSVAEDSVLSWQTALWFWMTPQKPKPSCHEVMSGKWEPTAAEYESGFRGGFGATTNIINGGIECGCGSGSDKPAVRVGYFERYVNLLGGSLCEHSEDSLWCNGMPQFGSGGSCPEAPSSDECKGTVPTSSTSSTSSTSTTSPSTTTPHGQTLNCESVTTAIIPNLDPVCSTEACTALCKSLLSGKCQSAPDQEACINAEISTAIPGASCSYGHEGEGSGDKGSGCFGSSCRIRRRQVQF